MRGLLLTFCIACGWFGSLVSQLLEGSYQQVVGLDRKRSGQVFIACCPTVPKLCMWIEVSCFPNLPVLILNARISSDAALIKRMELGLNTPYNLAISRTS